MAITNRRKPRVRANKKRKTRRKRTTHKKSSTKIPIVYGRVHATWCGHCTAMNPYWDTFNTNVLNKYPELKRFDIESDEINDKTNEFTQTFQSTLSVKGYPTIFKLYEKGGHIEYFEGNRSETAIWKWLFSKPKLNM